MSSFYALRKANVLRQQEWDPCNKLTLSFRGNELAGETGEACNIIKKIERERLGLPGSRATIDQLAEELSDNIICTDLIAMSEGIDLWRAICKKFNGTSEKLGLLTRLALAAETEGAWQPIDTAPDVYRPMILGHSKRKWIRFGCKYQGIPDWYYSGTNERSQYAQTAGDEPTHWQPLPEPPCENNGDAV